DGWSRTAAAVSVGRRHEPLQQSRLGTYSSPYLDSCVACCRRPRLAAACPRTSCERDAPAGGFVSQHRSARLTDARRMVLSEETLATQDASQGFAAFDEPDRALVLDLVFFYDNLGALVVHDIVDVQLIAGYLGGSQSATGKLWNPSSTPSGRGHATSGRTTFRTLRFFSKNPAHRVRNDLKNWRLPLDQYGPTWPTASDLRNA